MKCPHCNEELGDGDTHDLMSAHLWTCTNHRAEEVRREVENFVYPTYVIPVIEEGGRDVTVYVPVYDNLAVEMNVPPGMEDDEIHEHAVEIAQRDFPRVYWTLDEDRDFDIHDG